MTHVPKGRIVDRTRNAMYILAIDDDTLNMFGYSLFSTISDFAATVMSPGKGWRHLQEIAQEAGEKFSCRLRCFCEASKQGCLTLSRSSLWKKIPAAIQCTYITWWIFHAKQQRNFGVNPHTPATEYGLGIWKYDTVNSYQNPNQASLQTNDSLCICTQPPGLFYSWQSLARS